MVKHIRTLYKKLYSLELSFVLVIASPTTPTKAVAFLIYLLVINNMTDKEQFGAKTFIKFESGEDVKKIVDFCNNKKREYVKEKDRERKAFSVFFIALRRYFTAPHIFPTEPCTRRNGTLYSRAVLYLRLYCSQHPVYPWGQVNRRIWGGLQTTSKFISSSFKCL